MRLYFKPILSEEDIEKNLKFPPKMSNELAELIGIHFGDGCMKKQRNYTYQICYCFNKRDKEYAIYVKNLFYNLFNINVKMYENFNSINLYFISKSLCTFFNEVLKIPYSPKKSLSIPNYIISNKKYLVAFIRGLFDTDGCTIIQKDRGYNYNLIRICTSIYDFSEEIKLALTSLGIKSYICTKK